MVMKSANIVSHLGQQITAHRDVPIPIPLVHRCDTSRVLIAKLQRTMEKKPHFLFNILVIIYVTGYNLQKHFKFIKSLKTDLSVGQNVSRVFRTLIKYCT